MPRQAVCPRHHGEHVRANGHVCAAQYIGRDTWDRAGWRHVPSDRPCRAIGRAQRGVILRTTLTFDDNVSLQPLAQTFPNLHSATELQTLSWRSVSDGDGPFFLPPFLFWRFLILYGALYAGFGVQSPYLPSLLELRNLTPEAIATLLAAGTAIRLVAGPAAGRLAISSTPRRQSWRLVRPPPL